MRNKNDYRVGQGSTLYEFPLSLIQFPICAKSSVKRKFGGVLPRPTLTSNARRA